MSDMESQKFPEGESRFYSEAVREGRPATEGPTAYAASLISPLKERDPATMAADLSGAETPGECPDAFQFERWLLERLLRSYGIQDVRLVLWDGSVIRGGAHKQPWTVRIRSRRTLWRVLLQPEFSFPEEYAEGHLEIDGDLTALMNRFVGILNAHPPRTSGTSWWRGLRRTLSSSRSNVEHHYDLGNEFFRLWLDDQLLYTCAYFPREQMSLEAAQIAKMDLVCRKLRLRRGEMVVEAGCGWGAFALHMARVYGVRVRAFNVSSEQVRHAREQARQQGLSDQVEFIQDDWRNIDIPCDAFVSIGMLEHVGPERYGQLGSIIRRCLKSDGRGLIHSIGLVHPGPMNRWIERRIFPGAQPPTLAQMMQVFEPFDLAVLDVENLRLHYSETLRHWLERFEKNVETIRQMFDERFVRTWRMYLASSIAAFDTGGLQLYQVLFAPAQAQALPITREDIYA